MIVKLIFPPHFSVYQPYLSLPALAAFLKERGISVSQEDLNLSIFYSLMRPRYLTRLQRELETTKQDYEKRRNLAEERRQHYEAVLKALLVAPLIIPRIDEAISFFRNNDNFPNFGKYRLYERIIEKALEIVSAAYYPTYISLTNFIMDYSPESSKQIFRAIESKLTNPYIPFLEEYVSTKLSVNAPDLVGISLTSMSQVIPGFTLARIIKQHLPEVKIVVGGVIVNHLASKIKAVPKLFNLFDYLIRGEGETPLYKLCLSITGEIPLNLVPNLVYYERNLIQETNYVFIEEVNTLPTPDYEGFVLEKYLSPMPVLSIEPARGCYWRKCTFCNQYDIHGDTFRPRSPQRVVSDIKTLQTKYGATLFNISNEGVPGKHLVAIANEIISSDLQIQWYAGAQLKGLSRKACMLLKKAGCQKLMFGLESGAHRVLKLMNKAIILNKVPQILRNCTEANIDVHLYLMLGFPTETLQEIEVTKNFVSRLILGLKRDGFSFYISTFQAMINSPVVNQLCDLGYKVLSKGEEYDLEYIYEHHEHQRANKIGQRLSRQQLEDISSDIAKELYSQLPPQTCPEEITHYMCYRLLEYKFTIDHQENREVRKIFPNFRKKIIKKSDWISSQRAKFTKNLIDSYWDNGTIAYNLLGDNYCLLNHSAVAFIESLNQPKPVDPSTGEFFSNNNSVTQCDPSLFVNELLHKNIIRIEET